MFKKPSIERPKQLIIFKEGDGYIIKVKYGNPKIEDKVVHVFRNDRNYSYLTEIMTSMTIINAGE
mgnify:CR=1 FL=1